MGLSVFRNQATKVFETVRPGSTFLTVKFYKNNWGEVSDFSLCFHVSYKNAVARAKALLEEFVPDMTDVMGRRYNLGDLRQAREELISSYTETLSGKKNSRDTSSHAYDEVVGGDGKPIPGIKLHRDQDLIHMWGFGVHKKIYLPGNYGSDNRSALTMAKDDLRTKTPLGNFRQFRLEPGKFERITVGQMTIYENDVVRDLSSRLTVKKAWHYEELK